MLIADRAWHTLAATGRLQPFTTGRLYERQDSKEGIIIFNEPPAAMFDVKIGNQWDRLIIQAFDLGVYARQFAESKRLIEKGENTATPSDAITDLQL